MSHVISGSGKGLMSCNFEHMLIYRLSIRPLWINCCKIGTGIHLFSFKKINPKSCLQTVSLFFSLKKINPKTCLQNVNHFVEALMFYRHHNLRWNINTKLCLSSWLYTILICRNMGNQPMNNFQQKVFHVIQFITSIHFAWFQFCALMDFWYNNLLCIILKPFLD